MIQGRGWGVGGRKEGWGVRWKEKESEREKRVEEGER